MCCGPICRDYLTLCVKLTKHEFYKFNYDRDGLSNVRTLSRIKLKRFISFSEKFNFHLTVRLCNLLLYKTPVRFFGGEYFYCIVLKGWSLHCDPDLLCSPKFRYQDVNIPIKFCSEAYLLRLKVL